MLPHGRDDSRSAESREQPETGNRETATCIATPGADNAEIAELVALVAAFRRDAHRRIQDRADLLEGRPVVVRQRAREVITDTGAQTTRTNNG